MWILSPFLLLMFFLYCKCFSFNSIAYILSFLICEATSLCLAYGLLSSKQLFFVPGGFAPVCFFRMGDLSLMVSLMSQIYSSLETSKAATWQYFFTDTMHSHKITEMFNKHFFLLIIDVFLKLVRLSVLSKNEQVLQCLEFLGYRCHWWWHLVTKWPEQYSCASFLSPALETGLSMCLISTSHSGLINEIHPFAGDLPEYRLLLKQYVGLVLISVRQGPPFCVWGEKQCGTFCVKSLFPLKAERLVSFSGPSMLCPFINIKSSGPSKIHKAWMISENHEN